MKIFNLLDIMLRFIFFPAIWIWCLSLRKEMILDIKYVIKNIKDENKKEMKKKKTVYVNSRSKKYVHKQSFN